MVSGEGINSPSSISFTVYGEPCAQGRPRAFRMGNSIRMCDPAKSRNYKELVYSEAVQVKPEVPFQGELMAKVVAYFSIAKSKSKKFKDDAISGRVNPTKKPDCDNLVKIILDGCNGILYKDDSQVVRLIAEKRYSDNPRVEVEIYEV